MDIITVVGLGIAVCIVLKLLKAVNGEVGTVCMILAVCLLAGRYLEAFGRIYETADELFSQTGLDDEHFTIIIKALGVCICTQIGCDCCRDCGENALASQIELIGKASVLMISLPLFAAAIDIVRSLLMI